MYNVVLVYYFESPVVNNTSANKVRRLSLWIIMPVHQNFKHLEIEKEFEDDSEHAKDVQISINNLVNLEINHNTDANGSDNSLEKTQISLEHELNASSVQCHNELALEEHAKCSASHAKCGISCGQCHEVRNKTEERASQDSFPVMCQRNSDVFLKQPTGNGSKPRTSRSFSSFGTSAVEFAKLPLHRLRAMAEELAQTVEEVSSELVSLLLENDALQQESDARNIAIEQLLKLTWKHTENELRPVQMSVILPSGTCDGSDVD